MNGRLTTVGAAVILAAVLAAGVAGCPHNEYVIEMKPGAAAVVREVTVTRTNGEGDQKPVVPDEEVAHLAKAAGDATSRPAAETHRFKTRFTAKTPDDVGGAGFYRRFDTSMGSAFFYTERFRGDTDLAATAAERLAAADRLTDLLIGWFAANLKDHPGWERLRKFMDTDMRRDVRNLSMLTWAYTLQLAAPAGEAEPMVRLASYLLERGYFTPDELPEFVRASQVGGNAAMAGALQLVRRRAAEKMGIDAAAADRSLAFLESEAAEKTLSDYLRTTKEFKELQAKFKAEAATSATRPAEPDPMEVLQQVADRALNMSVDSASDDVLSVRMETGGADVDVVATNGQEDAETGCIEWSAKLEPRAEKYRRLGPLCYAVWVQPKADFQEKHFGKVLLNGEALMEYGLWRAGLPAEKAKQWDAFVESLKPGKELADKLLSFDFADEPAPTATRPAGEAARIIKAILDGLEEDKPDE